MRRALFLFALLAGPAAAQVTTISVAVRTVAQLPASSPGHPRLSIVTDGANGLDCSTGGGTIGVLCLDDGTGWRASAAASGDSFGIIATPTEVLIATAAGETVSLTAEAPVSIAGDDDAKTITWAIATGTTSAVGALRLATLGEVAAGKAVQASDPRLSDARTPSATLSHGSTHGPAGSDPLPGGTYGINAATATTAATGDSATAFFPAGMIEAARLGSGTADTSTYLRGDRTWTTVSAGGVSGPSPSTARHVSLWSDASGTALLDSLVSIDTGGNVLVPFAAGLKGDQLTFTTAAGVAIMDFADVGGGYRMRFFGNNGISLGGHFGGGSDYLNFGGGNGMSVFCEGSGGSSQLCAMIQGDFPDRSRGIRSYISVRPVTSGVGTPYAAAEDQVGTVYTNDGATAEAAVQLPALKVGMNYRALLTDADGLRVVAAAGETIRIAAAISTAGGYCESTTVGDSTTILAASTGWYAIAGTGSGWSCN